MVVDRTPHDAVQRVVAEGDEPRNALAVKVDDGETVYSVNGAEVFRMATPEARPYGLVGLRVSHRLDIPLADWEVESGGAPGAPQAGATSPRDSTGRGEVA